MYRHGGLFSVTSKILVNDFLSGSDSNPLACSPLIPLQKGLSLSSLSQDWSSFMLKSGTSLANIVLH